MHADEKGDGEGRARRTGYTMGDEYLHNSALTALGLWLASVGQKGLETTNIASNKKTILNHG